MRENTNVDGREQEGWSLDLTLLLSDKNNFKHEKRFLYQANNYCLSI